MKIFELLTENHTAFVTYRVTSPKSKNTYYGYAPGESDEDARRSFLVHAKGANPIRGDARFLAYVGDPDLISVKALDLFDNEVEAFAARNDLRAEDPASISGPSAFPGGVYKRMLAQNPDRASAWKMKQAINDMTARQAMGEEGQAAGSKLTYNAVKELVASDPSLKGPITSDLDALKYPQFMAKYFH